MSNKVSEGRANAKQVRELGQAYRQSVFALALGLSRKDASIGALCRFLESLVDALGIAPERLEGDLQRALVAASPIARGVSDSSRLNIR